MNEKTKQKNIIEDIIGKCLCLDEIAYNLYMKFAKESQDPVLSIEWENIASEEKRHVAFWQKAIELSKNDFLPEVFDNPGLLLNKLDDFIEKIKNAIASFKSYDNQSEALSLSFLLEAYMLDPIFMKLLHSFAFIDESIEEDYENHINQLIDLMRLLNNTDSVSVQTEFFCETLINLYDMSSKLLKEKSIDVLTGLYNRGGFFNCIEPLLGLVSRNDLSIGIIMSDIDNFKSINDTYGHPVGDKALKAVASIIDSSLRKSDVSGRYGGEEFIIFAEVGEASSLEVLCERIRANVEKNTEKLCGIHFTISLGAAFSKIEGSEKETLTKLINDADNNLLKAKRSGKNRWII